MTQESRLVIVIDSRNAQRNAQALSEEMERLDQTGGEAAQSLQEVGEAAHNQSGRMDKFKSGISALAAETKAFMAGLAGAAAGLVGALAALAIQTANTAAEIERLAYLSGATTTEFQEWAVGAQAMGIEMDKLSDIFKDTQDRVGDFIATGGGEMADFFTQIATKTEGSAEGALKLAKSMRDLSGAEALQLYVDKLQEAGVGQNEMIFYMESMADEATSLIPLLENGGEGFRLWAEAAHNAGAIMDDEMIAASRRLKIETQLLEMQMAGLKNQFMSGLMPSLNQILGAFTTTSTQALNMKNVAEALGSTLVNLSKVGMGVAATFDIVGRVIGGTVAAMTSKDVTHQMVLNDIAVGLDEWGNKFQKLNNTMVDDRLMKGLLDVQERANENARAIGKGYINADNMKKAFDDGSKSAKKVTDNTEKLAREAERAAEEIRKIMYEYSSEESQKAIDLQREISRLQKHGQTQYIAIARNRYEEERKLAQMNFEYDLVEFSLSEEKKLRYSFNIREQQIIADKKLTKDQTKQKLEALRYEFNQEFALVKLSQETRLFQMREALMSETVAMQERYRLEREQILLNSKLSEDQKKREIALSKALQEEENRRRLNSAVQQWGGIQAEMNGTGDQYRLEQERFSRYGASQDVFDAQMSQVDQAAQDPNANMQELAAQREAIWQEHHDRMIAIESDYYTNSQALQLAGMGQIASGLSSIVGDMAGEQSSAYKAMFAIEKGFAIAQSALAIQTGVSKAIALGFPQNIPVIAQTVMEGAKIASAIRAITDTGFANGGYTGHGGKYEPAGVVHKGEGVLTQEEVKALGGPQGFEDLRKSIRRGYATGGLVADTHRVGIGAVSAINSGGGNGSGSGGGDVYYTQTIHIASDGSATSESDAKQLGKMMENMTLAVIRREQRQGGLLAK